MQKNKHYYKIIVVQLVDELSDPCLTGRGIALTKINMDRWLVQTQWSEGPISGLYLKSTV